MQLNGQFNRAVHKTWNLSYKREILKSMRLIFPDFSASYELIFNKHLTNYNSAASPLILHNKYPELIHLCLICNYVLCFLFSRTVLLRCGLCGNAEASAVSHQSWPLSRLLNIIHTAQWKQHLHCATQALQMGLSSHWVVSSHWINLKTHRWDSTAISVYK